MLIAASKDDDVLADGADEVDDDFDLNENFDFNLNLVVPKIFWQFVLFAFNESIISFYSSEINQNQNSALLESFIEIQKVCSNQKGTLFLLYNSVIDQLRYQNKHTKLASILMMTLFENANDDLKELIIVCIIKRLLCVTQPPKSVGLLFKQITLKYEFDIQRILKQNGELQIYESAVYIINSFNIRKSKSENNIA